MSNSQPAPNTTTAPDSDWKALAKIGKVFLYMYILNLSFLLYVSFFFLYGPPHIMIRRIDPILVNHILMGGAVLLGLCFLTVWPLAIIRLWATPESIVPDVGIGKIYSAFSIVTICISLLALGASQLLRYYKISDFETINSALGVMCGLFFLAVTVILFFYMWQLAAAIGSQRLTVLTKHLAYTSITCVMLSFLLGLYFIFQTSDKPFSSNIAYGVVIAAVTGLLTIIGFLRSFRYAARDTAAFVKNHSGLFNNEAPQEIQE